MKGKNLQGSDFSNMGNSTKDGQWEVAVGSGEGRGWDDGQQRAESNGQVKT